MNLTMMSASQPFLTLPQVQSYLGIKSRKTVLKYIKTGKLAAYKLGGTRWRISPEALGTFLRDGQFRDGRHMTTVPVEVHS